MSVCWAMSGALAAIFSFEKSRKWIIREGLNGISQTGSGAPIANGLKKFRGLRIGPGNLPGRLRRKGKRRSLVVCRDVNPLAALQAGREQALERQRARGHPGTPPADANGGEPLHAEEPPAAGRAERVADLLTALVPGALVIYTAFSAGGYFAGTSAVAAVVVALLLALRILIASRPLPGPSLPLALAIGALSLFSAWVLLSVAWSDAAGRALVEFDRALLYVLVLALVGTLPRSRATARMLVLGLAAAAVTVCGAALLSRVLPEVVSSTPTVLPQRLSWPLTYWNALGLLAALGTVLCFYLSCDERGGRVTRILGAAALPVLLPTLLFTFSRGAIAAVVLGVLSFLMLGRPRGALAAVVAAAPAAIATVQAWDSTALQHAQLNTPAAVSQGHKLALVVALCVLGAMVLRTVLLPLDGRLARLRVRPRVRGALLVGCAATLVAGVAVALGPLNAVGWTRDQVDRAGATVAERTDVRDRLSNPGNRGRVQHWRVALAAHADQALHGYGAGTYQLQWAQRRPGSFIVVDGHSLYFETLSELGWVGLGLLSAALLAILAGLAARIRGPDRALYAALAAVFLTWALHAGMDWDWEMPVVTLLALASGAVALGAPRRPGPAPSRWLRLALALGLLALAVTPLKMALSQTHLRAGVDALKRDQCGRAVDEALASNAALGARPEPFEILGYCDVRLGRERLGVRMLQAAVRRDPHSWEPHYGLALVRAAAGLDPRQEALTARRLDPHERLTRAAVRNFSGSNRARWRRLSLRSELPVR